MIIVDRNTPVARLESIAASGPSIHKGKLERLERHGHLCRGQSSLKENFFKLKPPRAKMGADVVKALLKDRESSL